MAVVNIPEEKIPEIIDGVKNGDSQRADKCRLHWVGIVYFCKFVEIILVISITAVGTTWSAMNQFISSNPCVLVFLIFVAAIYQYCLYYTPNDYPGRPVNFIILTAGSLFLTVHVPIIYPTLNPCIAVFGGEVATAFTYLSYFLLAGMGMISHKGLGFRLLGLVVPIAVLIASQLTYLILCPSGAFDQIGYGNYMINITVLILLCLLTSYDTIVFAEKFGSSNAELKWLITEQFKRLLEELSEKRKDLKDTEARVKELEYIRTQF